MAGADPPIGSLCSGVGGLDLGVQAALGGHVVWHAESDPGAAEVLARHWQVPNLGDVRSVDWHQVDPVCVLTAGFPCQDLSVAGPRTGLVPGTRSGLWHYITDAVEVLNPCLVVIENVRGLLSTRAGTHPLRDVESCPRCVGNPPDQPLLRALGVLLADLADLGYDASWTCVRASDVGAPHRRERVFLTAGPTTPARRAAVEDADGEPGTQRRLPAPCQTQGRRPRPHPGRRDRALAAHPESQRRCQRLAEPTARRRQPHTCLHSGHAPCFERTDRHQHTTATCSAEARQTTARPRPLPCPCRGDRALATHPDLLGRERRCGHDPETQRRYEPTDGRHSPSHWWGDYLPAIRRWECVTTRAAPMATQPGTRRLSAACVEWMMGLPEGWVTATKGLSRAAQLRLLGNSVVPQQAAHALGLLLPESDLHHDRSQCCRSCVKGQR